jgi:hypothetical protein
MHSAGEASQEEYLDLVRRLVDRLEHLSADSSYAHRASGLRGSLLRFIDRLETGEQLDRQELSHLEQLLAHGFMILVLSAEEIGGKQ